MKKYKEFIFEAITPNKSNQNFDKDYELISDSFYEFWSLLDDKLEEIQEINLRNSQDVLSYNTNMRSKNKKPSASTTVVNSAKAPTTTSNAAAVVNSAKASTTTSSTAPITGTASVNKKNKNNTTSNVLTTTTTTIPVVLSTTPTIKSASQIK